MIPSVKQWNLTLKHSKLLHSSIPVLIGNNEFSIFKILIESSSIIEMNQIISHLKDKISPDIHLTWEILREAFAISEGNGKNLFADFYIFVLYLYLIYLSFFYSCAQNERSQIY